MSRLRGAADVPDSNVREILAAMDPRGNSAVLPIEQKRAAQAKGIARGGEPARISSIQDVLIDYLHSSDESTLRNPLRLRIYRPEKIGDELPVVVYLHGGGFFAGTLDTHDPACRAIAHLAPAIVVSVDYRLAPEHCWPAALEDAISAIEWASKNWKQSKLIVAGDSAGGNLAACAALQAQERYLRIDAQVLIYPMLDATMSFPSYVQNALVPPFTLLDCVYVWQLFLPRNADRDAPEISPVKARGELLRDLPRTLMLTAEYDILRDEGFAYTHALRKAGVEIEHEHFDAMTHGFLLWGGSVAAAREALARIAAFVR